MNKKITFLVVIALVAMIVSGCATTVTSFGGYVYEVESAIERASVDAQVLGPIQIEKDYEDGASYADIFDVARATYPNVDEVINIHIDYKVRGNDRKTVLTGLAIKYR